MSKITIYTDGACSGNPGIGGWGAILLYQDHRKEIYGGDKYTTNNKMELMAVIEALSALKKENCDIEIYTDSQYVKKGITEWLFGWKKNNWKNSKKQEVLNRDLWEKLDVLTSKHNIEWFWVKGHNNNELNERADELARLGIKELRGE
ncbi:MAG: ribonuclease HI [Rickettsiales bacterium]|nr:ribonuclease HI [Rickettsiales bacterium]